MKKNILIYGLISGIVVSILMLFSANNINDYDTSLIIGYTSMLVSFSLVFVGIRNYRDKYNEGVISFGKAFKIGILIVLIASTIYVVVWLVAYFYFEPDYFEKCTAKMLEKMRSGGASQVELDTQVKKMEVFAGMYKNPFFNALFTYIEILPVGLLVTLISSFILKRKTAKN